MFMPAKYQPDYDYLRHVPIHRVHLYTAIQITCLVILWVVKSIKSISIGFPVMVSSFKSVLYYSKRLKVNTYSCRMFSIEHFVQGWRVCVWRGGGGGVGEVATFVTFVANCC